MTNELRQNLLFKFFQIIRFSDEVEPGPMPELSAPNQTAIAPLPGPDLLPVGANFGDVIEDVNMTYTASEVVTVTFQGANPRHNMKVSHLSRYKCCG